MTTTSGSQDRPPPGEAGFAQVAGRHPGWLMLVVALMVAGCAFATWWQAQRALDGNLLSDFYAFMWPFYGGYVIYLGLQLRRDASSLVGRGPVSDPVRPPDEDDEELLAYNRYLAGKRADAQRRSR